MSREIKFRAWKTRPNMLLENQDIGMVYFNPLEDMDANLIVSSMSYIEDDTIVMQFTGLKDSKGKDIYEGDIIQFHGTDDRYRITYYEPWACFLIEQGDYIENIKMGIELEHITPLHDMYTEFDQKDRLAYNWAVIGNIYENPELLENDE